jgi:hypothetical protein
MLLSVDKVSITSQPDLSKKSLSRRTRSHGCCIYRRTIRDWYVRGRQTSGNEQDSGDMAHALVEKDHCVSNRSYGTAERNLSVQSKRRSVMRTAAMEDRYSPVHRLSICYDIAPASF